MKKYLLGFQKSHQKFEDKDTLESSPITYSNRSELRFQQPDKKRSHRAKDCESISSLHSGTTSTSVSIEAETSLEWIADLPCGPPREGFLSPRRIPRNAPHLIRQGSPRMPPLDDRRRRVPKAMSLTCIQKDDPIFETTGVSKHKAPSVAAIKTKGSKSRSGSKPGKGLMQLDDFFTEYDRIVDPEAKHVGVGSQSVTGW
jgi:hypothetical protein